MRTYSEMRDYSSSMLMVSNSINALRISKDLKMFIYICESEMKKSKRAPSFFKTKSYGKKEFQGLISSNQMFDYLCEKLEYTRKKMFALECRDFSRPDSRELSKGL